MRARLTTLIVLIISIIILTGCTKVENTSNMSNLAIPNTVAVKEQTAINPTKAVVSDKVTINVVFKIMTPSSNGQPGVTPAVSLPGVEILVINQDGKVIDKLITNDQGEAQKDITVSVDQKYPETSSYYATGARGTVTVIAFKEGYRTVVVYEVPVSKNSADQCFIMSPNVAGDRNEPDVQVGQNHHFDVLALVEKYQAILNSGQLNNN